MKQHLIVSNPNSELSDDTGNTAEEVFEEKEYESHVHHMCNTY